MKQIRNKFFIVFFLLFAAASANAQEGGNQSPPSPDSLAARDVRVLTQRLSLSSAQQAGVRTAAKQFHGDLQGLRGPTTAVAQRQQAIKATHEVYRKSLKDLLTPAQWNTYEEGAGEKKEAFLKRAKEKKIRVVE
jgi:phage-related minor tail protein